MAESKPKLTASELKARSIFPTLAEAQAFMEAQAERLDDWDEQTFVAPAVSQDDDGALVFAPECYESDQFEIMVAKLTNKVSGATTMKAVVMAPLPTLESLMANEAGEAFVREIVRKELNHRAVRPLRVVEDPTPAASSMPVTLESFITSQREGGGLLEAFDSLYKKISDAMAEGSKAWKKRKLNKADIRKSMESKGYALEMYPELEEAGQVGSLFVFALKLGLAAATREGLDPAIFQHWLDGRDAMVYDEAEEDEAELELDSLLEGMLSEEEAEASDDVEADTPPAGE